MPAEYVPNNSLMCLCVIHMTIIMYHSTSIFTMFSMTRHFSSVLFIAVMIFVTTKFGGVAGFATSRHGCGLQHAEVFSEGYDTSEILYTVK